MSDENQRERENALTCFGARHFHRTSDVAHGDTEKKIHEHDRHDKQKWDEDDLGHGERWLRIEQRFVVEFSDEHHRRLMHRMQERLERWLIEEDHLRDRKSVV